MAMVSDVVLSQDSFEMQADAIHSGQTIVVVDDLIATGAYAVNPYFVCLTAVYSLLQVDPQGPPASS